MTINRAIKEFLKYGAIGKGYSANTLRNYRTYLSNFATWAEAGKLKDIEKVGLNDIEDFQLHLREDREVELSAKTTNYYLIALRALLKYLIDHDIDVLSPQKITLAKTGDRQILFLEKDEIDQIDAQIPVGDINGLRDRAIFQILYSSGLRVSELVSLKRSQISLERGEFSIKGKGGKVRPVFVSEFALEALNDYLDSRGDTNPYIFVHHSRHENKEKQKPLTPRSIQRILKKYALAAGIVKPVTPHKLRHSFATQLLRNGADIRSVQALLGHSSITTTQVYTHVTDKSLREVHEKYLK